ncbi:MAG: RsiV family protein [Prevotellaceae bacterium]|nr:RsiV family protein [Prevotellaceae bacterium]
MKKLFYFLLFCVVVLTGGCQLFNQDNIRTTYYQLNHSIQNDTADFSMIIRLELLSEGVKPSIIDMVQSHIFCPLFAVEQPKKDPDAMLHDYTAKTFEEYQFAKTDRSHAVYEEIIDGNMTFQCGSLMCYEASQYVYNGGAHGNTLLFCHIFDLSTGAKLTETDLFLPDFETPLSGILIEHLERQSASGVCETFFFDNVIPNNNLYITPHSIVYAFPPYEIAPYVCGTIRICVPFNRVRELMNPLSVVYRYLDDTTDD